MTRRQTQRDHMRAAYEKAGRNQAKAIALYAAKERRGEAQRGSNMNDLDPDEYAAALFRDGIRKGWL